MSTTPIVSRISDYFDPYTGTVLPANGDARMPAFSGDGRLVTFLSTADNIVWERYGTAPDDEPAPLPDVFVHVLDSGYNVSLTRSLAPVLLPGGTEYAASVGAPAISPVYPSGPAGDRLYLVAFATDSAGWDRRVGSTASEPRPSDGSFDIGYAYLRTSPSTIPGAPTDLLGGISEIIVPASGEQVTGTPAFSADGQRLAYVADGGFALRSMAASGSGVQLGPKHLGADAPIGRLAVSPDGALIAFDSGARHFDLDGDGSFEVDFGDSDDCSNVFVYDVVAQTLAKVTHDSALSPAAAQGGHVGSFVPDPTGSRGPQLAVVSVADPATRAPLPVSQALLFTLSGGVWTGEIVSVDGAGAPAGAPIGSVAAVGAAPAGTPWVGFTSYAQNLPYAPVWTQPVTPPAQAWLGAPGRAPVLLTPGDPSSGYDGADADILDLALAPVSLLPADVRALAGHSGSFTLAAYATNATQLLGAPPTTSGHTGIYLASHGTPGALQPIGQAQLDYRPGSPLNPLWPGGQGWGTVQRVDLDATQDRLVEHDVLQAATTTSISARLGRAYQPDEPLIIVGTPTGTLRLAGGDDLVVGLPRDGVVDGGGGIDTLRIPAGTRSDAFSGSETLQNVERLEFDPAAQPGDVTEAWLAAPLGVLPLARFIGSPGADVLRVDIVALNGEPALLDLRSSTFEQWTGASGGDSVHVDANAASLVEVHAHPDAPMRYVGIARATVYGSAYADQMLGGDGADRFEGLDGPDFFAGGPGADVVDGGPGRDLASWAGQYASMPRPAPVFVDLADGLPERGGTAEGDVLVGIEDLWGSPDDDSLRGDAQDNTIDGHDGHDLIEGRGGSDLLFGSLGDDRLAGGGRDDIVHGGAGTDTGVWSGRRADFAISETGYAAGSARVVDLRGGSPEGSDITYEIERFRFDDGNFTLADLLGTPASVVGLAAADVGSVPEGPGATSGQAGLLGFELRRTGDVSQGGSVNVTLDAPPGSTLTSDDIATVGVGGNGLGAGLGSFVATFQPGQASATVFVQAAGDRVPEADEAVRLTLTGGVGITLSPTGILSATGRFTNDDVYPDVHLSGPPAGRVAEGNGAGAGGVLSFTLHRSGDLDYTSNVTFSLAEGAGGTTSDDIATVADGGTPVGSGFGLFNVVFAPGESSHTIQVLPAGDRVPEPDEEVVLSLVSAGQATLSAALPLSARGVIGNDDVFPELRLASAGAGTVAEGSGPGPAGVLSFTIERSGDLDFESTVSFSVGAGSPGTSDDDIATVAEGGTPVGSGLGIYVTRFSAGETSRTLHVVADADGTPEDDEAVVLTLLDAQQAALAANGPLSATGTFANDDLPLPQVALLPGTAPTAVEGPVAGAPASVLRFLVQRTDGDLSQVTTVRFRVQPGSTPAADEADVLKVFANGHLALQAGVMSDSNLGDADLVFLPGQTQAAIDVLLAPDARVEPDEHLDLVLLGASNGCLNAAGLLSARGTIVNDDLALQFPLLAGAREAHEGRPWALTITPQPAGIDTSALQFRIDWGDGSAPQLLTGAELAGRSGVLQHVFADDPDGPVDREVRTVQVIVTDPATQQVVGSNASVDVVDGAPVLSSFGFASALAEHHTPAALDLGTVIDVAGDPVQQLLIDWGDGPPQPAVPGGPVAHAWSALGSYTVRAFVANDDGIFEVGRTELSVTASAGHAPPNGTPAQGLAAWTDSLMQFSHKADMASLLETWSPVTLSAVNAGGLAGGDLYGGLLGVSGQSLLSSSVRQEIDGTEALRIELAAGQRADTLIVDLARLFTDDLPGLHEAGTVLLYDGSTLVGSAGLRAARADGRLHVELLNQPEFTSVIFRAGVQDAGAGGAFHPGGLVDGNGAWTPAPAGAGSDYLIESVQFLNLPDVPLVGLAADQGH